MTSIGGSAFANGGTLYILVSDPDNPPAGAEDFNYSDGVFAPAEQTTTTLLAGKKLQLTATATDGSKKSVKVTIKIT